MIEKAEEKKPRKGTHGGKRTPKKAVENKNAARRERYMAKKGKSQPEEMIVAGNECRIPFKSLRIEGKHIVFTF